MDAGPNLTDKEVSAMFSDPVWAAKFPPFLTVQEAAELARVPVQTIYAWSSQGLLKECSKRAGKRLLILRNKFVQKIICEGLYGGK
jgi:hypothetical protein